MAKSSSALRAQLVAELEKSKHLKTAEVKRAFRAVPREIFVPDHARKGGLEAVYKNDPIVTKTDPQGHAISSSSQPSIMAIMLDALQLRRGHRVLEVGAGTGYNAALLSAIVGKDGSVTSIDIDPELASRAGAALRKAGSRARVQAGDGYAGVPERGPYDRIIVTASTSVVPKAWWEQLVPGGLLEVPFVLFDSGGWHSQQVLVFERTEEGFRSITRNAGGFMAMRGRATEPAPVITTPALGVFRSADAARANQRVTYPAYVTGGAIRRLGLADSKKLLRLLLTEPRVEEVTGPTRSETLQTFLSLALPKARLISYAGGGRNGTGVLSEQVDSVAVATRKAGRGRTQLLAFGGRSAETVLRTAIEEWRRAGSPRDRDLQIVVTFDRRPPGWRVFRREGCYVGLTWGSN